MPQVQQDEHAEFKDDYIRIKRDVIKVAITNVIVLLLLVSLYFLNQRFGFLNNLNKFF